LLIVPTLVEKSPFSHSSKYTVSTKKFYALLHLYVMRAFTDTTSPIAMKMHLT